MGLLLHFNVSAPLLDWVSCFRFFSGLFCFIFRSLDVRTRKLALLLTHALPPSHPRARVVLVFVTRLSPILGLLQAVVGRGEVPTPSGGCGCTVPGAFVFVLCVLVGWA